MKFLPEISGPIWFLIAALVVFAIVSFHYFLVSGLFYLIFYRWKKAKWEVLKINKRIYPKGQFRKEIIRSNISSLIFGVNGAIILFLWQKGYIKIYENFDDYAYWWLPVSLVIMLIVQDTYYYWLHRWMHIPAVFRVVHTWHHDSRIASPWTAFSFHPLEAVLQAVFLPLILSFLPVHLYVFVIYLMLMTLSSVVNHLDIEIYPRWFSKSFHGRSLIGATHHAMHHKKYKYNYGLYFTWWDKMSNTESPANRDKLQLKKSYRSN